MKTKLLIFFASTSCFAGTLTFDSEVEVKIPGTATIQKFAPNEKVELSTESVSWVQAQGRIPLLVVPTRSVFLDELPMHLPTVNEWTPEKTEKAIDSSLELLIEQVFSVQSLLAARKPKEAREMLASIQGQYPHVTYLDFLRASCLTMEGDHEGAIGALKRALEDHPNHADGLKLLKVLTKGEKQ